MSWYNDLTSKFSKLLQPAPEPPSGVPEMTSTKSLFIVHDHDESEGSSDTEQSGVREVKIKEVTELGDVSSTSTFVKRDLGFQGKLGSHILVTYGDTMFSDAEGNDQFRGMTCNSIAIACDDPTSVLDPVLGDNQYPQCFLLPSSEYGEDPSVDSLGITNVVEMSHGEGMP